MKLKWKFDRKFQIHYLQYEFIHFVNEDLKKNDEFKIKRRPIKSSTASIHPQLGHQLNVYPHEDWTVQLHDHDDGGKQSALPAPNPVSSFADHRSLRGAVHAGKRVYDHDPVQTHDCLFRFQLEVQCLGRSARTGC